MEKTFVITAIEHKTFEHRSEVRASSKREVMDMILDGKTPFERYQVIMRDGEIEFSIHVIQQS